MRGSVLPLAVALGLHWTATNRSHAQPIVDQTTRFSFASYVAAPSRPDVDDPPDPPALSFLTPGSPLWRTDLLAVDNFSIGAFLSLDRAPLFDDDADHFSAGLTWTGPLPSRKSDVLGAAVTYRRPWDRAGLEQSATAVTGFYQFHLAPHVTLIPDIQFLSSWEGRTHQDAVVVSVQLEVEF